MLVRLESSRAEVHQTLHGDDFTSAGPKSDQDWTESKLEAKYELKKGGRLGPGPSPFDSKELTILNRVIRWTEQGIEYEADPRQGERRLRDLDSMRGASRRLRQG